MTNETKLLKPLDMWVPSEIIVKIGKNMPKEGQDNFVQMSNDFYSMFRQPQLLVTKLLEYVAFGNQDKVEQLLKIHPELLLERGTVTDYSGRTFKNITAFEYALWALDVRYMAPMMIRCLPKNEDGEKIREALLHQFNSLEENGISYTLDGKTHTEKHFDFKPLQEALKTYGTNYNHWNANQRETYWCKVVGGAQRLLPSHVAQHYCDPETPFYPLPTFDKENFLRTFIFYNWSTNQYDTWFPLSKDQCGLGVNFGILRDDTIHAVAAPRLPAWPLGFSPLVDLVAITTLCTVRTADLELLKQQLGTPLQDIELISENNQYLIY